MALPPPDANGAADDVQLALVRGASMARRVASLRSLSQTVIALSRRAIGRRHPQWSEADILIEFVAVHYGRDLAKRVRDHLHTRAR